MGIDTAGTQLLFGARALGADFSNTLTVGRHFFYPEPDALGDVFRLHGIELDATEFIRQARGWSESLFQLLGAATVTSMDASGFEGADLVHDLNDPVPNAWKQQYSLVFDGGTLEHVFDFPQALRNCMDMVKPDGWFVQMCPANNFMGHGFYQISPELIYRAFAAENGYQVVAVLIQEAVRGGRWYTVTDPAKVGRRVQMTNRLPVNLCTIARRISAAPVLQVRPLQSDYSAGWQKSNTASGGVYKTSKGWRSLAVDAVRRLAPAYGERFIRELYTRSLRSDPECFTLLTAHDLVTGRYSLGERVSSTGM